MQESHGIHKLLDEIEQSKDLGLYYVTMLSLLSVPDHMAALGNPSGETNGTRFKNWYEEHVDSPLQAEDAWQLRCSLLHQARSSTSDTASTNVHRIAFAEPSTSGTIRTGYMAGSVMLIHVPDLCDAIIGAARRWLVAHDDDPIVQANLDKTLFRGEASHGSGGRQINTGITMVMSTD